VDRGASNDNLSHSRGLHQKDVNLPPALQTPQSIESIHQKKSSKFAGYFADISILVLVLNGLTIRRCLMRFRFGQPDFLAPPIFSSPDLPRAPELAHKNNSKFFLPQQWCKMMLTSL